MSYRITEIEELSGPACRFYSVAYNKSEDTLLDDFLDRLWDDYPEEVEEIWNKLEFMGREGGARLQFFRENEGKPGDGVVALLKERGFTLRLYGIRYGSILLILGSGGVKPKSIQSWQQDPNLATYAQEMIKISAAITKRIRENEIIISDEGELSGNLEFEE